MDYNFFFLFQTCNYIETQNYADFLQLLVPFDLDTISTASIEFCTPLPLLVILKNSPYLKNVELNKNLSNYIFTQLQKHCPYVESITLTGAFGFGIAFEDDLFKAFFSGIKKKKVMNYIACKEKMTLSFPKLKVVNMIDFLYEEGELNDVMYYIQYFYSSVKFYWKKILTISTFAPSVLHNLTGPPLPLQGKGDFHIDILELKVNANSSHEYKIAESSTNFIQVRQVIIDHSCWTLTGAKEMGVKIRDFLEQVQCTSFNHFVMPGCGYVDSLIVCRAIVDSLGLCLSELRIDTSEELDGRLLCECINHCPDLSVLSVSASCINRDDTHSQLCFTTQEKLKRLGMDVLSFTSDELSILNSLITAAPNLIELQLRACNTPIIAMELPLSDVASKIQALSLYSNEESFSEDDCNILVETLRCLSLLMLSPISQRTLNQLKIQFSNTKLKVIRRRGSLIDFDW